MKASELIAGLQKLIAEHGDLEVDMGLCPDTDYADVAGVVVAMKDEDGKEIAEAFTICDMPTLEAFSS